MFLIQRSMMKKQFKTLLAFFVLALMAMACAVPPAGNPDPSQGQVSTAVALTFQALTPGSENPVTPTPADDTLLPHSLYFLANDTAGLVQVFRLERDGKTRRQVTS